jgi:outer membrane receptor protein involved in Fe transport
MIGTLAAALTTTAAVIAPATAAAAQARDYDIAAGPLKQALDSYVRQSGLQIVYRADEVRSATSPGVHGRLSAEAALDALLAGSGFTTRRDGRLIAIVKAGNVPAAASDSPPGDETAAAGGTGVSDSAAIVITGSNIRGSRPIGPLHTLDRNDIERSGYSQVGELIRSLPENFGGGENPGHVGVGAGNFNVGNASTVNLRGLGDGATLTLLNGRRMAGNASGQSVDISGIPLAALQRVDIVADGSSAIYGSDAVAGVVNFITRQDVNGAEVSAHVGVPTEGGGLEQTYSALGGLARPGWNALLSVERSDQDEILASQRSYTSQALPYIYLLRPQKRTSVFFDGGAGLSDSVELNLQALWNDRSTTDTQQRLVTAPREDISTDSREYFISGGLEADLGARWSARVNATTAGSAVNFADRAAGSVQKSRYKNENSSAEAIVNGPLLPLPGGALNVAFGGGWRKESYNSDLGSASGEGSHDILYLFGELHAPLIGPSDTRAGLNALELSASGRYEHYSDYGGTFTPKFGLRYVPFAGVAMRVTWGKSFKAPTFQQVSQPSFVLIYPASIFVGGTTGSAFYVTGGGGDLTPERSTSWTIGTDIAPRSVPALRIGITYFKIDYRDRVVNPIYSPITALSNPAFSPYVTLAPSAATQARYLDGARVVNLTGTPYDPDTIAAIVDNSFTNAASQRVRGGDLSIRYSIPFSGGQIAPFANATWIRIRQQTLSTLPEATISDTLANIPQFRARGGTTLELGHFTATGIVNYQDGSIDTAIVPNRPISSLTTFDLNLTYSFQANRGPLAGVDLTLATQNLFNRAPPYAAGPAVFTQGIHYDSVNASPIGRVLAFNIRKRF